MIKNLKSIMSLLISHKKKTENKEKNNNINSKS